MAGEDRSLPSLRDSVISQVKERDGGECRNCEVNENIIVDSVVPIKNGGNKNITNLVTLCRSCEKSKNNKNDRNNSKYPDNWDAFRKKVYQRDNYTCQNCGLAGKSSESSNITLHSHHIVPKSDGGNNTVSNCITLCEECHAACHSHMSSLLGTQGEPRVGNSNTKKESSNEDLSSMADFLE